MRVPLVRATREAVRYGFAVGKVRVLQARIFGAGTYERLLDAPSYEEQRRVLSDTFYGRYLEEATTSEDVERALERALDDIYRFTDEANLPEPVRRFFRVRYDWANLKGKLKAEAADAPIAEMLQDLGTLPAAAFEAAGESLPEPFRSVYVELRPLGDTASGEDIDEAVDRAMFADLRRHARASRSDFLRDLSAVMIDVANLKALARARLAGRRQDDAMRLVAEGGSIPRKSLEAAYTAPPEDLQRVVGRVAALAKLSAAELGDPTRLDVIADDVVVRFVRRHRASSIGPEPVIAYVLAREAEVMMVRMLLIGRLAGVPSETLRARLREMYV